MKYNWFAADRKDKIADIKYAALILLLLSAWCLSMGGIIFIVVRIVKLAWGQ